MKAREVRDDQDKLTWNCVQAFTATNGMAAEKAVELSKQHNMVEVICTPTGGAQTVRLKLHENWIDSIDDNALLQAIRKEMKI
jgi:hypothetical protein